MRRLYVPDLDVDPLTITGSEAHHGRDVLRLIPGNEVEIFDGRGRFASATVLAVAKSGIHLLREAVRVSEVIRPQITLASAIPKFARQEILVRMGTEIGVSVFVPLIFQRSSVREKFRAEKWRRWTLESCKQCQSNYLPHVRDPVDFKKFIPEAKNYNLMIYGSTESSQSSDWRTRLAGADSVLIFVGPEGGFTPEEQEALQTIGVIPMRIGPNVLRIETAAVALCAITLFRV